MKIWGIIVVLFIFSCSDNLNNEEQVPGKNFPGMGNVELSTNVDAPALHGLFGPKTIKARKVAWYSFRPSPSVKDFNQYTLKLREKKGEDFFELLDSHAFSKKPVNIPIQINRTGTYMLQMVMKKANGSRAPFSYGLIFDVVR